MRSQIPAKQTRRGLQPKSRLLFHFRPRVPSLPLNPITLGDRAEFTRSGTATATDSNGRSYTVAANVPRWAFTNGIPRVLVVGSEGDVCRFPYYAPWRTVAYYHSFIVQDVANGTWLFHHGDKITAAQDPRVYVEMVGTGYMAVFDNGSGVSSTLTTKPVVGQLVEIFVELDQSTRMIRISQRIEGGAIEQAPWSAAEAAWPTTVSPNQAITMGGHAETGANNIEHGDLKVGASTWTFDELADAH